MRAIEREESLLNQFGVILCLTLGDLLLCLGEELGGELALHLHEFLHEWLILLEHLVVALGHRT